MSTTTGSTTDGFLSAAADLLFDRIGLKVDASFRPRLARALQDVSAARQLDCTELVADLASNPGLLDDLLDQVTVQETAFFRHPEQFSTMSRELMPTMSGPVRAWSAACANGQEAYSLAMSLAEFAGEATTPAVLATDISTAALQRATIARYANREMTGVDDARRRRWFQVVDNGWQVRHAVRKLVTVRRYNLLDTIPEEVTACQIVMCRNVLIYFGKDHAESFLHRLSKTMRKDAYLFVGGAETLWQLTDRFEALQLEGGFVYRPIGSRSSPQAKLVVRPASPSVAPVGGPAPRKLDTASPAFSATPPRPAAASTPVTAEAAAAHVSADTAETSEALGARLLAVGNVDGAIVALRRWTYEAPDEPRAHFHLGAALEGANEHTSARRAYRAALAAIDRADTDQLHGLLQGYEISAFRRLILDRCDELAAASRSDIRHGTGSTP